MTVKRKVTRTKSPIRTPVPAATSETKQVYHLVTLKMVYLKEDIIRERTVNVLMETPTLDLAKRHLLEIQKAGMQRIKAENNVDPDMVKDAVILNISTMGYMTAAEFAREAA